MVQVQFWRLFLIVQQGLEVSGYMRSWFCGSVEKRYRRLLLLLGLTAIWCIGIVVRICIVRVPCERFANAGRRLAAAFLLCVWEMLFEGCTVRVLREIGIVVPDTGAWCHRAVEARKLDMM